ncbi:MAG: FAD-dependent 5-carboxymethylaminomethyl-2-thiouridine(34) oxidoreductase MnmC, partial [Bdellovibrionales bacterium]|nr:FAD-dependent 5-carboxymethylaminomethyl-2-thiouridine(34) oxidoreductase MnmC [Bdellovibrionales bacterium]
FDDIYSNPDSPLEESRYVYSSSLSEPLLKREQRFVVAELGFGTGLNFLLTAERFLAAATQTLCYISFEKHPLEVSLLQKYFGNLEESFSLTEKLLAELRTLQPGINQIRFGDSNVSLTLVVGDAESWLPQMQFKAHAWYLDGFAPTKNPDLWTDKLLAEVSARSVQGSSLATFTCAGFVRRALIENGWQVSKQAGFGKKREMLRALFSKEEQRSANLPRGERPRDFVVIGAGIAGCSLAYSLQKRGLSVRVLEKHSRPGEEASGNPLALVMPDLSRQADARSFLLLYGLQWAHIHLKELGFQAVNTEVLRLPTSERLLKLTELLATEGLLSNVVEVVEGDASNLGSPLEKYLRFKRAFTVYPQALCEAYLHKANISIEQANVTGIAHDGKIWSLDLAHGERIETEAVILANAWNAQALLADGLLPFRSNRGQVLRVAAPDTAPNTPVCFQGYLAPIDSTSHVLGASYEHTDHFKSEADLVAELSGKLSEALPTIDSQKLQVLERRGAIRSGTPDRMPFVGPLFEQGPHLYLSCCFGSRGFTLAPLASEYLAALINDEPLPLDRYVSGAIAPGRYLK